MKEALHDLQNPNGEPKLWERQVIEMDRQTEKNRKKKKKMKEE